MINVDNPRVRMLLIFIGLMAATFIIIYSYNLLAQSSEIQVMNQRICDDYSKNEHDLGVRSIQGYADSICDCKQLENGTWNCIYSSAKAGSMTKNLTGGIK
jgi:hypothetical protein